MKNQKKSKLGNNLMFKNMIEQRARTRKKIKFSSMIIMTLMVISLYPVFNNGTASQISNEFINIEDTLQNENLEGISNPRFEDSYMKSHIDIDDETTGAEPYQHSEQLNNRKPIDQSSAIKINDAESNPGYGFG